MDKLISDLLAAEQIDGSQYFVAVIDGRQSRTWKEFGCVS